SLVGCTWTWPALFTEKYPLPQRATSYSSFASWTVHARAVEVFGSRAAALRPLVAVLMPCSSCALRVPRPDGPARAGGPGHDPSPAIVCVAFALLNGKMRFVPAGAPAPPRRGRRLDRDSLHEGQ